MLDDMINKHLDQIKTYPKLLWFMILSYAMLISISNWFDVRLIEIFGLAISPGTLVFPITFLLSDIITEVYGYKNARLAIWSAFLFNILFILFGQIITHLPSPHFASDNSAFDKMLHINFFVIIGSFLSYIISEPLNSIAVSKLKVFFEGKYMAIRFVLSTIISSGIDSFIFTAIAFGHLYPMTHVIKLMLNIWVIKVIIEIIGLSFSIRTANIIKKIEGLDIYDINTNYNLFKINATYDTTNNKYSSKRSIQ